MSAEGAAAVPTPDLVAPSLRRRLGSFAYEGILLFGVLFVAEYLFASLTQQRHALYLREVGMGFLFIVLGIYFVWFWSRGGQTLAMKTWHIRVVGPNGRPPTQARALARYLAAWLWFLLPVGALWSIGVQRLGGFGSFMLVIGCLAGYAMVSIFHPTRQFLHDLIAGTRLVAVDTKP
jgi:uncharacterized RDD family membrane protein YckC